MVLAEDDVLLREGLASLLERSGFEVVGLAGPDVDAAPAGSLQPAAAPVLIPVPTAAMPDSHGTEGTSRSDE